MHTILCASAECGRGPFGTVAADHAHAFLLPYFKTPVPIAQADIEPLMNAGKYTFVLDIPPNFQRDVLAGRQPGLQFN
jgi:ABC-2 type transport system permease protein